MRVLWWRLREALRQHKEATMKTMVTRRQTALVIPTNSSAYFKAAGFLAIAGLLLWAAEQD